MLVPGAAQERHVGAVGQFAPFVLASRPLVVAQRGRVVRVPAEPLGLLGFDALVDGLADRGGAQRVQMQVGASGGQSGARELGAQGLPTVLLTRLVAAG